MMLTDGRRFFIVRDVFGDNGTEIQQGQQGDQVAGIG
jgi:hypothetical protein